MSGTSWLDVKALLIARGFMDADGISRRAGARTCDNCGRSMLVGLDHDRVADVAKCDPTPLNRLGEANALMQGRATYSLRWTGQRYELDYRYAEHITGSPAGSDPRMEVLGRHACEIEVPGAQRGPYLPDHRTRTTTGDRDEPAPF